jgi:type I restriction enzyme S subunit
MTIPEGWKETILGEIAEINPSERLLKGKIAKYVGMEYLMPYTRKIAQTVYKEFKGGMKFRNGDTLVARITPCLENGKTSLVDVLDLNEVGFGSTEFIVIRKKENVSNTMFLFYFSISPKFREIAIKSMTGTSGRQRVQIEQLVNQNFAFPPLPEQKAIADVLSSFDNKIELLREQNKTLETIAQTIFNEWFVSFNFLDENGKPYQASGGKMIDSELGPIPGGWRVGKLGEEFKVVMGQSPEGESYNETRDGIIFFQGRTDFKERFPEVRLYTTSPKRFAEKFDILVSVRAPVGDINVASEKCCIGRGLCAVRSNLKSYSLYKIKTLQGIFNNFEAEGTVFGSINKDSMLEIKIVIPPEKTTLSYEEKIIPIDRKIYNNYLQIQTITTLRDVLLPKLMRGEIRVKEVLQNED